MKKLILLSLLSFFFSNFSQAVVEPDYLKQKLSELVASGDRWTDEGRRSAREYLAKEYQALGYEVNTHSALIYNEQVYNLIAEKKGRDPSIVLIVGAHYDTVRVPGADDDGSGIVTALAIAKELSTKDLDYTVRFIAFDREERGLLGSIAYLNDLVHAQSIFQIWGAIIFEMTGYDSNKDGAYHIIDCRYNGQPTMGSDILTKIILDTDSELRTGLKYVPACTDRSDHASFWHHGIPSVVIGQNFFGGDGNPCYHKDCDTVQQLDFNYMAAITALSAVAVERMLSQR